MRAWSLGRCYVVSATQGGGNARSGSHGLALG